MSTKIRARVWAANKFRNVPADKWAVTAHARNEHGQIIAGQMRTAPSHPEAMQAAYKLLHELDAELMEDVHASRASRRTPPPTCPSCDDERPALGHVDRAPTCIYHRPAPQEATA